MKLADIVPGSELAYQRAARQIIEQLEAELEICRELFGTEPKEVMALLNRTENWDVFFEEPSPQPIAAP
jgi:hypothetical protein